MSWRKVTNNGLGTQHDLLGAQELHHHARHAARRDAVQRRLRADASSRRSTRRRRASTTPRPAVGQTLQAPARHLDGHADDRVRVPVAALHQRLDGQLHATSRTRRRRRTWCPRAPSAPASASQVTGKQRLPDLRSQRGPERDHGHHRGQAGLAAGRHPVVDGLDHDALAGRPVAAAVGRHAARAELALQPGATTSTTFQWYPTATRAASTACRSPARRAGLRAHRTQT